MPPQPKKPADFIRLQFRDALKRAGVSQAELSRRMAARTGNDAWTPSRLSKLLNGRDEEIVFRVDDLVLLCEEAGISLVEVVRQTGREFVADLKPSELMVLNTIRHSPALADHILGLLPPLPTPRRRRTLRELAAPIKAQLRALNEGS